MRKLTVILMLLPSMASGNPPMTTQEAFQGAQGLASSQISTSVPSSSSLNNTLGKMDNTYYGDTSGSNLSGLFGNTTATIIQAATNKIFRCANAQQTDRLAQQDCNAVNLMVNNPQNRPTLTIQPSFFAASKDILANANTSASASIGGGTQGNSGFSACTNRTSTPTEIRSCNEFTGPSSQQCVVGNEVVINDISNYECEQTMDRTVPQTCEKTLVVTVTQPSPIPATTIKTCSSGQLVTATTGAQYCSAVSNPIRTCNTRMDCSGVTIQCNKNASHCLRYSCPTGTAMLPGTALASMGVNVPTPNGVYCLAVPQIAYTCPTNTTLTGSGVGSTCVFPPVVSSSINNGCTVQEAAAL